MSHSFIDFMKKNGERINFIQGVFKSVDFFYHIDPQTLGEKNVLGMLDLS